MAEGARRRSTRARLLAALVLVTATATPATPARAHLGHVVLRAERYLKLEADAAGVRVVVSLTLGPQAASAVLQAADADADGAVSRTEADAYMAQWGEGLRADLPVTVDGAAARLSWGEPFLDPIGPVRALPGTVEMSARLPLEPGVHTVVLRDRMRAESVDRTDVAFRARDGARLLASGVGEQPTEAIASLAFGASVGGIEVDRVAARFEVPEPPPEPLPPWVAPAAALALVLGALAIAAIRRRARAPRHGPPRGRAGRPSDARRGDGLDQRELGEGR